MAAAVDVATVTRVRRFWRSDFARHLAVWASILIVWEATVRGGLIDPLFLASPLQALDAGWQLFLQGSLGTHVSISLKELAIGFSMGAIAGTVLGTFLALSRSIERMVAPTMWAVYAVPRIAFIPVLVVWFGIGLGSKVAIVFLGAIFPVAGNVFLGLKQVPSRYLAMARSFGASRIETLRKVHMISVVPYLVDGLRLGFGRGLIGVIVAEMYVSQGGIGHLMLLMGTNYRTPELIFLVALTAAFGVIVTTLWSSWEARAFADWRNSPPSSI